MQTRFSICARFDAAAVCTSAVCPWIRVVSTMPRTVIGLTKQDAPWAGVTFAGSDTHWAAGTQRNRAYISPAKVATVVANPKIKALGEALFRELLNRGVFMGGQGFMVLSTANTPAEIDRIVDAVAASLRSLPA